MGNGPGACIICPQTQVVFCLFRTPRAFSLILNPRKECGVGVQARYER